MSASQHFRTDVPRLVRRWTRHRRRAAGSVTRGDLSLGKSRRTRPRYTAASDDLAIACGREGQLDKARKAYDKALELEPNNTQIRQNYDLFKEINDRVAQQKDKS